MTQRIVRAGACLGLAAFALLPSARAASRPALAPPAYYAQTAKRLAAVLPREHLIRQPMDDTVSRRAWTNYLAGLDYNRMFFLESDIADFRQDLTDLDNQLQAGDLSFGYKVFDVYTQRVSNRCYYVRQLLEQRLDFTVKESFQWKRDEAPWPADEMEWNDLWRRKIKNDHLRLTIARELAKTSATNSPPAPAKPEDDADAWNEALALTPDQLILKQHQQFRISLDDADAELVLQRYLSAFAQAYDPHSDYLSPTTAEDFDIEMKLSLVGIGALLRPEDGAARIARVIPGGPAAGDKRDIRLRAGDKIIAVGQDDSPPVDVLHKPLYKTVRLIRGRKGTRVVLVVIPASDPTRRKVVDLIRDEVKLEEQAAKLKIAPVKTADGKPLRLGVVTVPAFYANMSVRSEDDPDYRSATRDVCLLLEEARSNGVNGILVDLRGNGGGALPEAVAMTGLFIESGPVVLVRERSGVKTVSDRISDLAYDGPLFVLVNRASASASEIFAAALQDYGRAVIVGDSRTHGKGTVQSVIPLGFDPRLGKIKITSWVYYRLSGVTTQVRGVASDIVIPSPFEYMDDIGEGELPNALKEEWAPIAPARYTALADLKPAVTRARETLRNDETANPRLASYMKLLQKIREMNDIKEWPLNIEERRTLAKMENELAELREKMAPDDEDEPGQPGRSDATDIVLDESLRLMAEFVAMQQRPPAAAGPVRPAEKSGGLLDALKRLLGI
ncbi:MAG: carboxy terminal-processing peptidase [Verrucomicrobiota bacterium]|nr:carboxy terminal-processing peptidase [Verrucomicrobiota bacterium]